MNIWLIEKTVPLEFSELIAAFSTDQKAKDYFTKHNLPEYDTSSKSWYEIIEVEVDTE